MTYDPRNDPAHPIYGESDPTKQGQNERGYGNGYQLPWQPWESRDDYLKRTDPPPWER